MEREVQTVLMAIGMAFALFLWIAGAVVLHGDRTAQQKKGRVLGWVLLLAGIAVAGPVLAWYFGFLSF